MVKVTSIPKDGKGAFVFFLYVPRLDLWGSPFWVTFAYVTVF